MRNNKKGFTLVELLAVIVILAVVMLIGITSMGPIMANSRKSALKSDGIDLMNAAKTAYQAEAMTNNPAFQPNQSICFDITWLVAKGYAENKQSYNASVLVKYDSSTNQYSYTYWIGNKTYDFLEATGNTDFEDAANHNDSNNAALQKCGNKTPKGYDLYCTGSSCSA
jgi:prepilin-type N-terminal cleavage/methylation domain